LARCARGKAARWCWTGAEGGGRIGGGSTIGKIRLAVNQTIFRYRPRRFGLPSLGGRGTVRASTHPTLAGRRWTKISRSPGFLQGGGIWGGRKGGVGGCCRHALWCGTRPDCLTAQARGARRARAIFRWKTTTAERPIHTDRAGGERPNNG